MKDKLSCGFIIRDTNTGKLLGCHPYGRKDNLCDISKGGMEPDESYLECALRELREETGLTPNDFTGDIKVYGRQPYNNVKDLYLFYVEANVDLYKLHCDSTFEFYGKEVPEMASYELGDTSMYFKNLKQLLDNIL